MTLPGAAVCVCAQVWDAASLTCLATLEGHEDNVRVLAVGHGYLFSGSWDKTVRVGAWAPQPAAGSRSLAKLPRPARMCGTPNHTPPPPPCTHAAAWPLPDCHTSGSSAPLQVWSCDSLTCIKVLEGHNEAVLALAVGDLFLASGSYDTTIRFWDLASWQCVRKAEGHDDAVRVLAAADGSGVISGAYDGAVGVW